MDRQIWQVNPNRDCFGDVNNRIEIRSPTVQVEALRTHEVRPITEDQVTVLPGDELKKKEASTYSIASNPVGDQWSLVFLDPIINCFRRPP